MIIRYCGRQRGGGRGFPTLGCSTWHCQPSRQFGDDNYEYDEDDDDDDDDADGDDGDDDGGDDDDEDDDDDDDDEDDHDDDDDDDDDVLVDEWTSLKMIMIMMST